MATQRNRGSYYDVNRTYTQAEFNELLRQLAAREDLARRDFSTLQTTYGYDPGGTGSWGSPDEFRDAAGNVYRAVYVDAQGRPVDRYIDGPEGRMVNPNAQIGYYETALDQGGPGKGHNTFKLSEEFGVRPDQDWLLAAQYNPDGTLRDIVPRERVNESSWVSFRDALKPVAAMAALVAGGNWLANALQGAGAAGATTGAPGLGGMAGQGISVAPAQGGLSAGLGVAGPNAGLGINVAPSVGGLGAPLGTVAPGAGGLGLSVTPEALAAFDAATGISALAPQVAQAAQTSVLGQGGKVLDRSPSVLDRVRQVGGVVGDLAPIAGLAGAGAGAATIQPPVQPQAPTVPGAEAPPEARGYQAARDPIIDVLQRNRRGGGNRTLITGYGGVPMESVRTGGNTLLGL